MSKYKDERLSLYKKGKTDREIAETLHLSRPTITIWRNNNGLKPHERLTKGEIKKLERQEYKKAEHLKKLALYKQGLMDHEIAEKLYMQATDIYSWRKKNGFPPNGRGGAQQITPEEHQRRLSIYNANKTAGRSELGRLMGLTASGVRNWEIKYGLGV